MAASHDSRLRVVHFDDTLTAVADAVLAESVVRNKVLVQLYPFIPSHISYAHGHTERDAMHEWSQSIILVANVQLTGNLPTGKDDMVSALWC